MRTDCRHYESRHYPSGDTVQKCDLDLAPEAPWRCPDDCPRYERKTTDIGWNYGSLVQPPKLNEPADLDGVAELLDSAEDILNEAGPRIMEELEAERSTPKKRWGKVKKKISAKGRKGKKRKK